HIRAAAKETSVFRWGKLEADDRSVRLGVGEMRYCPSAPYSGEDQRCSGRDPPPLPALGLWQNRRCFDRPDEGSFQIERILESLFRILRQAPADHSVGQGL